MFPPRESQFRHQSQTVFYKNIKKDSKDGDLYYYGIATGAPRAGPLSRSRHNHTRGLGQLL